VSLHSNLLQASVCALQAQLRQQPSLEGLPDVLLHRIMCIVWDARPASEASSEVQLALSLQCLSRRFQRVLRAHPLQLRLDFSTMLLAERHLAWLALPAWKDHVTSLTLYNWLAPACEGRSWSFLDSGLCADNDVVSPLLTVLHANQRGSLRQLLGMPLRLGGVMEPPPDHVVMSRDQYMESLPCTPHVDLSAIHLTHLGISGGFGDEIHFDKLPQTLVRLLYRAAYERASVRICQPYAAARMDLLVTGGSPVVDLIRYRALDGWRAVIEGISAAMVSRSSDLCPYSSRSNFTGVKEVCIDARCVTVSNFSRAAEKELGLEVILDLLCPACVESTDIYSGSK